MRVYVCVLCVCVYTHSYIHIDIIIIADKYLSFAKLLNSDFPLRTAPSVENMDFLLIIWSLRLKL